MFQGKTVQRMEYTMSGFLDQCCVVFQEQFNVPKDELGKGRVGAPFLEESPRTITQCKGRCSACSGSCCSGNFAKVRKEEQAKRAEEKKSCLLYTSPSPRD
eukprot:10759059-Alexandrium_andersonii.AAC.1